MVKCLKCPSTWVNSKCLGAWGTEYPLTALQVPKCTSALRVPSMFEYPLSVFKCTSRTCMSNQMWLEQSAKHRNMFHVKRKKCKKKKMIEKNLRSLILKQYQSASLKGFWNWFGISDLCKILLFLRAPI